MEVLDHSTVDGDNTTTVGHRLVERLDHAPCMVDFVGIGRMVLSYPELPAHSLAGTSLDRKRICRTFSDCTSAPRHGLLSGCFPLDAHYKSMPDAAVLAKIKRGGGG